MAINRISGKKGLVLLVILALGLLANIAAVNAAPQVVVDCTRGCVTKAFYPVINTYVYYVKENVSITLQGTDLSGGVINWAGEGVSYDGSIYSFVVKKDTTLIVTASKDNMIDRKTIEIHLTSTTVNNCFPEWDSGMPIEVDKEKKKKEFIRGDRFSLKANYYYSSCDFIITWMVYTNNAQSKDIVVDSTNSQSTFGTVSPQALSGSWITIKAVLSHKNDPLGQTSEKEFSFSVVDKPPAPDIVLDYGPAVSFSSFTVDWSASKAKGSSNNFVYDCSFVLKDEHGKVVDKKSASAPFGDPRPLVTLRTNETGAYNLTATCRDSFGTPAILTEGVPVGSSDSKQNKPYLIFEQTTIYCEECVFYFNETNKFGKNIKAEYYDITNVDNDLVPAYPCIGDLRCPVNVTYPGTYKFRIKAWFSWYDGYKIQEGNKAEAIVYAVVGQGQPGAVPPTIVTTYPVSGPMVSEPAVNVPQEPQVQETYADYRYHKSIPAVGGFTSLVILVAVMLVRKYRVDK